MRYSVFVKESFIYESAIKHTGTLKRPACDGICKPEGCLNTDRAKCWMRQPNANALALYVFLQAFRLFLSMKMGK